MRQSRMMSGMEALMNVSSGYILAVLCQLVIYSAVGLDVTLRQAVQVGLAFTLLSLLRSYALRRLFNLMEG